MISPDYHGRATASSWSVLFPQPVESVAQALARPRTFASDSRSLRWCTGDRTSADDARILAIGGAFEDLMRIHGHAPSFRIDTDDGERTIFSNGTIINHPHAAMFERLGRPGGALGFVVADPEQVLDAEPGLPIAFVKTNALYGSAIVCRKHVLHMGRKPPAWTSRRPHQVPAADS